MREKIANRIEIAQKDRGPTGPVLLGHVKLFGLGTAIPT